jgi:hypothetical protein
MNVAVFPESLDLPRNAETPRPHRRGELREVLIEEAHKTETLVQSLLGIY